MEQLWCAECATVTVMYRSRKTLARVLQKTNTVRRLAGIGCVVAHAATLV